jgi:hypothetical protein
MGRVEHREAVAAGNMLALEGLKFPMAANLPVRHGHHVTIVKPPIIPKLHQPRPYRHPELGRQLQQLPR